MQKKRQKEIIKSECKTAIRKYETANSNGDAVAVELLSKAKSKIDSACSKGVISKNAASRKKSRLETKLAVKPEAKKETKKAEKKVEAKVEVAEEKANKQEKNVIKEVADAIRRVAKTLNEGTGTEGGYSQLVAVFFVLEKSKK